MSSSPAQSASAPPATSEPAASPTTSPPAASVTSAPPTSSSTTSATPASSPSSSAASSAINSLSSNASSSVSSTGSSSVAASTTATTSTPSSSLGTSSSSSISFVVETSNGQILTRTAVVTLPPSASPTQSQSTTSGATGFFHNTGAVAGVFSVVGVIAIIVIFFLLTSLVRRRRARKLDREIEEAAAAAAGAQLPDFDDYDYTSGRGYGHYSETSHGTFNQPPLSHESHNNLADIPTYEPYGGAGGAGAGAAGIGARGRSMRGGVQPDPYGALANPPEQYEMYETRRSWNQGNPQGGPAIASYDILQAAGLAGSDPYAVTRRASTGLPMLPGQSQPGNNGLNRSQSKGASATLPTTVETYPTSTPAPAYPGGQDTPYPPEKARYSASYAPGGVVSTMPPDTDEDPYSGYNDQPSASLDNPHSPGIVETHAREDGLEDVVGQYQDSPFPREEEPARASIADDEDYGYNSGRRVLRVANE